MMTALPTALTETGTVSTGETVFFWILAPLMVLAALGLLFARRAVYAAMSVVFVMVCLAALYVTQEAVFLGMAQIIVYTGAIMMLFLFVLMLVGVDAADSLVETIKGQRVIAFFAGIGLAVIVSAVVLRAAMPAPAGLAEANTGGNPSGVARVLFSDYIVTMQMAGIMLVTAAVGAVVLTRTEQLRPKRSQREVAEARMQAYAAGTGRIRGYAEPGVYARHNAADVPALSAGGRPIEESVPRVLRVRGQQRPIASISPEVTQAIADARKRPGTAGDLGARTVRQSGEANMPGLETYPGSETLAGETPLSSSTEDITHEGGPESGPSELPEGSENTGEEEQ